ncbi:hypothetical protein CO709_16100 [Burkholderia thailandensis]|nr:hypothetical protein CO709_16100 [Burkholderia thailandensis]
MDVAPVARARATAPGIWSVVKRAGIYKSHPDNFLIDIKEILRRLHRCGNFLISLEVLGAAQHRAAPFARVAAQSAT